MLWYTINGNPYTPSPCTERACENCAPFCAICRRSNNHPRYGAWVVAPLWRQMTVERHYTGCPTASNGAGEVTWRPQVRLSWRRQRWQLWPAKCAIPLKTAFAAEKLRLPDILDLATAMGRCVTIKRNKRIKRSESMMGKAKRKPRPSMPDWYWYEQDGCWFCRNNNNCNQCKANRSASKEFPSLKRKRDKISESSSYRGMV